MSKSIISNEKECYVCRYTRCVEQHHIFFGTANRKISDKDGCWVYLCQRHHTSFIGVHNNRDLDLQLKRICQQKWEEINGDREQFIKRYGRSYL